MLGFPPGPCSNQRITLVKKTVFALLALTAGIAFAPAPVRAQDDMLSLGVGYYDVMDGDEDAADFRAEYRWGSPAWWQLKPFAGLEFTSDSAVYGLGGLYMDWVLAQHIYMTPSVGVGVYSDGDGKDLGYGIEFRSQLELSYALDDNSRLGLGLSHISNAGIDSHNPGTEVLSLYYHVPVDWFSSHN